MASDKVQQTATATAMLSLGDLLTGFTHCSHPLGLCPLSADNDDLRPSALPTAWPAGPAVPHSVSRYSAFAVAAWESSGFLVDFGSI